LIFKIVLEHSHGKWPIYRWFTWVCLLKLVIFHGYVSHNQMVTLKHSPAFFFRMQFPCKSPHCRQKVGLVYASAVPVQAYMNKGTAARQRGIYSVGVYQALKHRFLRLF
jgi:hypothetical protein